MARSRTHLSEFAGLLDAAQQPIYLLDSESVVVFCNRACLDWLGCGEEDLVGRRCAYHSLPDAAAGEAMRAGLALPPEAILGKAATAVVAAAGRRHAARLLPLESDLGEIIAVLAVVDAQELTQPAQGSAAGGDPDVAALHDRIREFRRQMALRYRADTLLGDSLAARRIRNQVQAAAASRASVLIFGPPGSGRRQVATTIHYAGAGQASAPLIPLSAAALSSELIHATVRSAAMRSTLEGKQPQGTLLLGDVDQLALDVQAALATVLSGRSFSMRVVATAQRSLLEAARRGEFRDDLAYALSTIVIQLPALGERREDLPLLAQSFLEDNNARGGKQLGGFAPEALDRLDAYGWPGNCDELAQVVAEACAQAEGPLVQVADLPSRLHLAAEPAGHPRRKDETIVLDEFLERIERELIGRAMRRARGNKTKAARLLGMTRPRLYRRLLQLDQNPPRESPE